MRRQVWLCSCDPRASLLKNLHSMQVLDLPSLLQHLRHEHALCIRVTLRGGVIR